MAITKQTSMQGPTTITFSTGLDSLANADRTSQSGEISNDGSGEHWPYAMFELVIATQGVARSAGAHFALYILPKFDGTNYPEGDDTLDPMPTHLAATFSLDATTAGRRVIIYGVPLPPVDFKVLVINNSGQSTAGSGNTLKIGQYSVESPRSPPGWFLRRL